MNSIGISSDLNGFPSHFHHTLAPHSLQGAQGHHLHWMAVHAQQVPRELAQGDETPCLLRNSSGCGLICLCLSYSFIYSALDSFITLYYIACCYYMILCIYVFTSMLAAYKLHPPSSLLCDRFAFILPALEVAPRPLKRSRLKAF